MMVLTFLIVNEFSIKNLLAKLSFILIFIYYSHHHHDNDNHLHILVNELIIDGFFDKEPSSSNAVLSLVEENAAKSVLYCLQVMIMIFLMMTTMMMMMTTMMMMMTNH